MRQAKFQQPQTLNDQHLKLPVGVKHSGSNEAENPDLQHIIFLVCKEKIPKSKPKILKITKQFVGKDGGVFGEDEGFVKDEAIGTDLTLRKIRGVWVY